MELKLYHLPAFEEQNAKEIEALVLTLQKRYRNGTLDDVELTWLDQANNWLDVCISTGIV